MASPIDAFLTICNKGKEPIKEFFMKCKMKLLGLNEYQLESIDEQRKISILLFENMPFLALLLLIKAGVIRCDVLNTEKY